MFVCAGMVNSVGRIASGVLSLALVMTGAAQTVDLDVSGNVDPEYIPGQPLTVEFVFSGTGVTTEEVTALGWEVSGFPAGTEVITDAPANNCEPSLVVNPGPPGAPAVNVKRPEPAVLNQGQPNEACNPIMTDGTAPFEFFFLARDDNEGETTPHPVTLPVTVQVEFQTPAETQGDLTLSVLFRYRIDSGEEVNNEGAEAELRLTIIEPPGCVTTQGDADGNGSVTPGDAQLVFLQFLGVEPLSAPECVQCDGDDTGNITPGDAQAIFDVFLGVQAMCDGSHV